jgi:hypothetical protein
MGAVVDGQRAFDDGSARGADESEEHEVDLGPETLFGLAEVQDQVCRERSVVPIGVVLEPGPVRISPAADSAQRGSAAVLHSPIRLAEGLWAPREGVEEAGHRLCWLLRRSLIARPAPSSIRSSTSYVARASAVQARSRGMVGAAHLQVAVDTASIHDSLIRQAALRQVAPGHERGAVVGTRLLNVALLT